MTTRFPGPGPGCDPMDANPDPCGDDPDGRYADVRRGDYTDFSLSARHLVHGDVLAGPDGAGRRGEDGAGEGGAGRREPARERLFVVFQTRGYCVVEQAGRTAVVPAGALVLYADSLPFTVRSGAPSEQVVVGTAAARAFGLAGLEPTSDVVATTVDCRGVLSAVAAFFVRLADTQDRDPAGAMLIEPHAASLAASLLALADRARVDAAPAGDARRERVVAYIRSHAADPDLDAARIAAAAGVSVRSLYRLFEGSGRTPVGHLRALRVEAAQHLLRRHPDRPVAIIAREVGFRDERSFYRVFRDVTGGTPARFRAPVD